MGIAIGRCPWQFMTGDGSHIDHSMCRCPLWLMHVSGWGFVWSGFLMFSTSPNGNLTGKDDKINHKILGTQVLTHPFSDICSILSSRLVRDALWQPRISCWPLGCWLALKIFVAEDFGESQICGWVLSFNLNWEFSAAMFLLARRYSQTQSHLLWLTFGDLICLTSGNTSCLECACDILD